MSFRDSIDLNLDQEEVDSFFRLRYDIIHRNHAGELIIRSPSQWDSFHSRRIWGVIGIVDCTDPELYDSQEGRDRILQEAQEEFMSALKHFPSSCVSRVIVFTTPDAAKQRGASVMNSPSVGGRPLSIPSEPTGELVFGYVPESTKYQETRLELKVQIVHFSGLLLNSLDRECWKIERASIEMFISPLDEPNTPDKQSKLIKRRPGRQDKLLGDNHLMMGAPAEALTKYNSAIEKAKANSDRLWLAGAMEGWSAAHVFCYVKGGGAVGDQALSNKLIEHYSDIYKLYQKKRIPELEALAALRLAEFLGRFTTRRKDALEAADHAAAVGESLSSQKRAALWECLARFSEYMKCHRKAAFYMYRVGSLCASKAVWSSSEALLTASGKQFKRGNGKIWPDLHRDILLEAGKSAWEVGDAFLATQHYVEALALSASTLYQNAKSDASLVKLLVETTTPAYLPAAAQLVSLQSLNALQIPSLLVKEIALGENDLGSPLANKNGPFIYNPFAAKAREKAAAAASRAVTWVCGEAAQVSLRIQNRTHTDLPIEIIAVAIVDANRAVEVWPAMDDANSASTSGNPSEEQVDEKKKSQMVEEDPQVVHARRLKTMLRIVTRTVETLSETVPLPPLHSSKFVEKTITVFPKRTGAMHVCGLVARLFRGTIVLLSAPKPLSGDTAAPPINVIKELPRVDVSIKQEDGEFSAFNLDRQPAIVFEGERRRFSVRVKNVGKEDISDPNIQVTSSNPGLIQISMSGKGLSRINETFFKVGQSYEFVVEVFANRVVSAVNSTQRNKGENKSNSSEGVLNASIVYTGKTNRTMVRESRAMVSLVVRPAVRIGSFSPFRLPAQKGLYEEQVGNPESRYGLILDVENLVPMPVMIALPPSWRSPDIIPSSKFGSLNTFGLDSPCPTVNVLECGASTRLITVIPNSFFSTEEHAEPEKSHRERNQSTSFALSWAMPGIARNGIAEVCRDDILKVGSYMTESSPDSSTDPFNRADNAQMEIHTILPQGHVGDLEASRDAEAENGTLDARAEDGKGVCCVNIRKYYTSTVVVCNRGARPFPANTVLDLCILQHDGRGGVRLVQVATLVGAVECVRVGALAPGETFEHSFKMRFTSAGTFELNGFVHEWEQNTATSLDAVLVEVEGKENEERETSRNSRWSKAARSRSLAQAGKERPKSASPPKTNATGTTDADPPIHRGQSFQVGKSGAVPGAKTQSTGAAEGSVQTEHKRTRSLMHLRREKISPELPRAEEAATEESASRASSKTIDPVVEADPRGLLRQLELARVLCRYTATFCVTADKWETGNLGGTESPFGPRLGHAGSAGRRISTDRMEKPQPDNLI